MGGQATPSPIPSSSATPIHPDPCFVQLLKAAHEKETSVAPPTPLTLNKSTPKLSDDEREEETTRDAEETSTRAIQEETTKDAEETSTRANQSGEAVHDVVNGENVESDSGFGCEAKLASPLSSEAQAGQAKFEAVTARWVMHRRFRPIIEWIHDITKHLIDEGSITSYISKTGVPGASLSAFYTAMGSYLSCTPNTSLWRVHPFLNERLAVVQPRIPKDFRIDLSVSWSPPTDEEIELKIRGIFQPSQLLATDIKFTMNSPPSRNMKDSIIPKYRKRSFLTPAFCILHQHVLKSLRSDQSLISNPLIRLKASRKAQPDSKRVNPAVQPKVESTEDIQSTAESSTSGNGTTQPSGLREERWLNRNIAKCMAFVGDKLDTMFKVALGLEVAPNCPPAIRLLAQWLLTSNLSQGHRLDAQRYFEGLIPEHDAGSHEETLIFLGHDLSLTYKPDGGHEEPELVQGPEQPEPANDHPEKLESAHNQPEPANEQSEQFETACKQSRPAQELNQAQEPVPPVDKYPYPELPHRASGDERVEENAKSEDAEPYEDPDKTILGTPEDTSHQVEEENIDAEITLVEIAEDARPSLKRAAAALDAESEDTNDTDRPHKRIKETPSQIPAVGDPPLVAESARKRRREDDGDPALQPPSNRQRITISDLPPGLPIASGTADERCFDRTKLGELVSVFRRSRPVQIDPSSGPSPAPPPSLPPTPSTSTFAQPAGVSPPLAPSLPTIPLNPIPTFITPTPAPSHGSNKSRRFPVVNMRARLQNITNLPTS